MQNSQSYHSFETLSQQLENCIIKTRKPTISEIKEISQQFFDKIRFCLIHYDLKDFNKNQKENQEILSYILEYQSFHNFRNFFFENIKLILNIKNYYFFLTYCLNSQIHEYCKNAGIAWLLENFTIFCKGLATPLLEKHVILFKKVIIPLLKVQTYHLFHNELANIFDVFILYKDSSFKYPLLQSILRYWPYHNTQNQLIFLVLILNIINICECQHLQSIIPKLFYHLLQCLTGSNLQVTDQESFIAVKTIIKDLDTPSFEEALAQKREPFQAVINGNINLIHKNEEKWKILFAQAKQKDPSICEPMIPYLDTHSLTEHNLLQNEYIYEYD
ncbi:hypothetical protein ABPG72_008959 [Tetrahymena utriculariae]